MTTVRRWAPSRVVALLAVALLNFTLDSLCCIGFSASSSLSASPYYSLCCGPNFAASHLVAKGVPNVPLSPSKDIQKRAEKCQNAEFGAYQSNELRRIATLYPFYEDQNAAKLSISCSFDASENCAWHNAKIDQFGRESETFKRARFEAPEFNWDKFECTSKRAFPLEGYFLLAGGRDGESLAESKAAIEAKVPCQTEKAMLKFDFWSINETPTLKVCVVPERTFEPHCEESKMDINPLTFEIPQNARPFRLRIEVDNIAGREDIVLIDNIQYDHGNGGTNICPATKNTIDRIMINGEEDERRRDETVMPKGEQLQLLGLVSEEEGIYDEKAIRWKMPFSKNGNEFDRHSFSSAIGGTEDDEETFGPEFTSLCEALQCNFNNGKACEFKLRPIGGMSSWKVGDGPVGNPHTGIHKSRRGEAKFGYAFVGSDLEEAGDGLFVLGSPKLRVDKPITLQFDLFQRSVGPQLRVCLNTLWNCAYASPTKPDKAKHWLIGQKVILPRGTERVLFLGSKLRRNHFIAIDNIRLLTMNFRELCATKKNN